MVEKELAVAYEPSWIHGPKSCRWSRESHPLRGENHFDWNREDTLIAVNKA